ncbi:receptor like protein 22-like [Ipomoea triloba]|uniref:receptor like protein 22-like n=1 Tax=Ipomoea triloba TaxID=35885 RepID=UPI00125DE819|nr:receptor like protein 22-like [Ipomoea triloba]
MLCMHWVSVFPIKSLCFSRYELKSLTILPKLVLWDEGADCCRWPGLSCNAATGYITSLDLSYDYSIRGGFNVSLLHKLPSLSVIRLDGVNFSAPFPDLFTDFTNLTVLTLADCDFSGTVPQKVFQVPTLQTIDLSYNFMLGGSLPDFPENGSLKSLTLRETMFSGNLPESIGNLRLLSHIDLAYCDFSGSIPVSIIKLSKLVELSLSQNSFSGPIPASLFFLPSLQTLYLDGNKLSGHINELRNVTSPLEYLDLSRNNLEGTIPLFFFHLQNLTSLDLSSNKFNSIVHLTKFKSQYIETLDFSNNNLVIETTISTSKLPLLPQFGYLNLASCNLQKIPDILKSQSKLWWLDLSNNTISGEIPNWIWGICNGQFSRLNLSHNSLTHMKEPMEYGSLYSLDLNSNMLSGQIPRPPPWAMYLDFSNNNFSMIPLDFADQIPYFLQFFSIAKNRVSGKISTSWCRAAYLKVLDLSYNALHGTIPSCLVQNNSNLVVVNLRGNHLSGEISLKFQQSCSLDALDLSQNLLEGKVPPSLINCTELRILNLGNNKISDTFPCWLNKLSNLQILVLHSNHFHGSVSCPMLGVNNSWPSLQVIDLSSNNFSGHLPTDLFLALKAILVERNELNSKADNLHFTSFPEVWIYYQDSVILSIKGQRYTIEKVLSTFTSIDFSSNQFEGSIPESVGELKQLYLLIPESVGELKQLYLLNISHNALTGNIPPSLQNLKALEALDLSFNNLAGNIPVQLEILTFLEVLNLSYNHLVGMIPRSTQLDTFDASSFMGNKGLCGFQINVSCTGIDEPASPIPESEEKESTHHVDIYISVALGFVAAKRVREAPSIGCSSQLPNDDDDFVEDPAIKELPVRLGRWLLSNFDSEKMCVLLGEGEVLPVREENVSSILGFPWGEGVITMQDRYAKSKLLTAWRKMFEKHRHDVSPAELAQLIREDLDGGLWFKRHFMVLLISSLISCMGNGYSNQIVFHHLDYGETSFLVI